MTELKSLTSLRVGGAAANFVTAHSEAEIIAALEAVGDSNVLIVGGGTNILVSDAGFDGTVIHISNNQVTAEIDACSGATLSIGAGENWDALVALTVERGFAGLETLSGIPGTVGAAPIQNIGAYGHEVSEFITRVRTYDRVEKKLTTFTHSECDFSYRSSHFKKNPGRYVILEVQFQLRQGELSDPIAYAELATELAVELGSRVLIERVRASVLKIRARKGMLLDENDHDSWSAGSFFTNPIVAADIAASLPADAPRFPQPDGRVKLSAAWLIEHAGIKKGQVVGGARVSTKHVLALTNSGNASAADVFELAVRIRDAVFLTFGIKLEPEVNTIGFSFN